MSVSQLRAEICISNKLDEDVHAASSAAMFCAPAQAGTDSVCL